MARAKSSKVPSGAPLEPARSSERTQQPSTRKRAQSSISSTQQSSKKSKSTAAPYKTLAPAAAPRPDVIVLEDEKEDEQGELEDDPEEPEELEEPDELEEPEEPEKLLEELDEDDIVETTRKMAKVEGAPMKFIATWRAVAGKERLPGVQSREYEEKDIYILLLEQWKDELLASLRPREFWVVRFEAVASYERCKVADERPQELRQSADLSSVLAVLKSWYKRWLKRQLSLRITLYLQEEKVVPIQSQQAPKSGYCSVTQV